MVVIDHVRKSFVLKHTHSFKEAFIAKLRGKKTSTSFDALHDVSFTITKGESVAILGHNGSGKSTLLKLISGVFLPDGGSIRTRGKVGGLIEVGAGFHPDLTGRQNVFLNAAILGMSKVEIEAKFDEIVEFSGIAEFIDNEVKHYSSGMFLRLAFSVAIHCRLDTLLVDEILAVGDAEFREKCTQKIRELLAHDTTMIVVSHDLPVVEDLCERGILIERGRVLFDGPITEAIRQLHAAA